ncbi:MAG: hypothetical protein AAGI38_00740 [Bacteroidota bacterium]
MPLLVSQKNQVFQLIEEAGLNPAEFVLEEVNSRFDVVPKATRMNFREGTYYFLFEKANRRDMHYVVYCPGLHEYESQARPGTDWYLLLAYVKEWLGNLQREVTETDRWQKMGLTVAQTRLNFGGTQELADIPFTEPQQTQIKERFQLATARLEETDLTEEQIEVLKVRFDHLGNMSGKLGRTDWESLMVGTLVSAFTSLGVGPETARMVWEILRQAFGQLLLG